MLIQGISTIFIHQLPTFHVFRKAHTMMTSKSLSVYHVNSQVLWMKRCFQAGLIGTNLVGTNGLHFLIAAHIYCVPSACITWTTQFSKWRQQKPVNFIVLRPVQIKVSDGPAGRIHNVTCNLTFIVCLLLAIQTLVLKTVVKYDWYLTVLVKDEF